MKPENEGGHTAADEARPLKNADFRKLLMTPREPSTTKSSDFLEDYAISRGSEPKIKSKPFAPDETPKQKKPKKLKTHSGHRDIRRPAKEIKEPQTPKYRDRAKERRDGKLVSEVDGIEPSKDEKDDDAEREEYLRRTADYRAVAPNAAFGNSTAERRKALIQESKYLGGDMEHTHLVKGLDYVLLQKTRQKIRSQTKSAAPADEEEQLDAELARLERSKPQATPDQAQETRFPSTQRLLQALFVPTELPERNEYFVPGRMAYRVELDDELADSDVPATVIRSKQDLVNLGFNASGADGATSTNDLVIEKLTQILAYLRAGKRQAKKMRKYRGLEEDIPLPPPKSADAALPIFDEVPESSAPRSRPKVAADSSTSSKSRYFDEPESVEEVKEGRFRTSYTAVADTKPTVAPALPEPREKERGAAEKANLDRLLKKTQVSGYDECYPESYDVMGDSDEETDFSKMDAGAKRGPMGRWDFDTQEEYSDYMSSKEALPKAAFQFGVKTNEGRKTRRIPPKDDKAQLDREWNKIQAIMQKRKGGPDSAPPPPPKVPR